MNLTLSLIKKILLVCVLVLPITQSLSVFATDYVGTNFTISDPIISTFGIEATSTSFRLISSGTQFRNGESTATSFIQRGGFLYYPVATAPVITAVPLVEGALLTWTASVGTLANVTGYEVGISTVSGGPYTYQNVGNVLIFVKNTLTGATTYYFKVRSLASTLPIGFSGEVAVTPSNAISGGGGGGGGSGGGGGGGTTLTSSPNTIVLSGLASPGASVTLLKDGQVAANTTADPGAKWSITLNNLKTGVFTFAVFATDSKGNQSATLTFTQSFTTGISTSVNNLFIAPTINADLQEVKQGDTLTFFGYTKPAADVTLFVHSDNQITTKAKASPDGSWFKQINTAVLELGDHNANSQGADETLLSTYSQTLNFKVGKQNVKRAPVNSAGGFA
jgi:hypothetical protein